MSVFDPPPADGPTKALLYCRVSTKRQAEEGHGLDGQEHRCRQYAAAKGYSVEAVFPDDVSGGGDFLKRPGMVALLAYLDAQPDERYVVIFDDLKRYARDTEFHLKLRREMAARGATRECLNFNFEDSPEGKFFETIAAAQGELERAQNGRQVTQKMRARVESGYWCLGRVPGYRYEPGQDGDKVLVPDEPLASIIKEAFEGYASGRFQSTAEVKRFLESFPITHRNRNGEVSWQTMKDILRRPIYAGYLSVPRWNINLKRGRHEAIITFEVWKRVQDKLAGRSHPYAVVRPDMNADFPLRGFVSCASCNEPMTAAWSKGRSKHYPYYVCYQRGCERRGKSIRRDVIETDFEKILSDLSPSPLLLKIARAMFRDRWEAEGKIAEERKHQLKDEIRAIDGKINKLVDRIVASDNDRVIQAYENQIRELDHRKIMLTEKVDNPGVVSKTFDESFRTAWTFLSNPWKLWTSDSLEHKRLVLRLAFTGPLAYAKNEGFRTASIAEPLRVLGLFGHGDSEMVGAAGIEPATPTMST